MQRSNESWCSKKVGRTSLFRVSPHLVYTDDAVGNEVSKNADDYERSRIDGRMVTFLEQEQRNDTNDSRDEHFGKEQRWPAEDPQGGNKVKVGVCCDIKCLGKKIHYSCNLIKIASESSFLCFLNKLPGVLLGRSRRLP